MTFPISTSIRLPSPIIARTMVVLLACFSPAAATVAVNCGADSLVTASDGLSYEPDAPWSPGNGLGHLGGEPFTYGFPQFVHHYGSGSDFGIYLTEREGMSGYRFEVEPGEYEVTMRFIETEYDGPGLRPQTLFAGGNVLLDSLDIYAEVGKARSLDVRRVVTIGDGPFDIDFEAHDGPPVVSGIGLRLLVDSEPPLAPVNSLESRPAIGGVLLTWRPPATGRIDGYRVRATLGADIVFERHRYPCWAVVPMGEDLVYSVEALDGAGVVGEAATIPGTEAWEEPGPLDFFEIQVAEEDLRAMERALVDFDKPQFPATLVADGEERTGTVQFRGVTSLRTPKKSYKFRIDDGEDVDGSDVFGLSANFRDETMLRELYACDVIEAANLPAYRVTPTAVTLNGEYAGLFQRIEEPDEDFLDRLGLDPSGRSYKINCDLKIPDAPGRAIWCYENTAESDAYRDDIIHLIAELQRVDSADAESWLHDNFYVDALIDWYASQIFVANGDMSIHNFIMHRARSGGPWTLLPWDMDGVWRGVTTPANFATKAHPDQWGNHNRIVDLMLQSPALMRRYLLRLSELLDGPWAPELASPILQAHIDRNRDYGMIDMFKMDREWNASYERSVEKLSTAPTRRHDALRESILRLMPPWWVDLSLNEVVLGPGPVAVEIESRARETVGLSGVYLTDDRDDLLKWPLGDAVLAPGERWLGALPPVVGQASWLGLAIVERSTPMVIDSVSIPAVTGDPAIGRFPDAYGRFRLLPQSSPGLENAWTTPVELDGEVNTDQVWPGDRISLSFEMTNTWRPNLDGHVYVELEGESGIPLALPPLFHRQFVDLGPGDARNWSMTRTVPFDRELVPPGRYDFVISVLESPNGDRLAVERVAAFVLTEPTGEPAINEICASNRTVISDEANEYDDWVEIINPGPEAVDLGVYHLTDDYDDDPFRWSFPPMDLGPGERVLVWLDGDEEQGDLHAGFKLDRDGEELALVRDEDGEPRQVDYLDFGYQETDESVGRYPDGGRAWERYLDPTPLEENRDPQCW